MKDNREILIDAIGKVDEKYITKSMSTEAEKALITDRLIRDDPHAVYGVSDPADRELPPQKKRSPIKIAVISGLAAAFVIAAGVFAISKFGAGKIDISDGQGNSTGTETTVAEPAVTTTSDAGKSTNPDYLREMYPEYFNCSTFKGLEVYPNKDPFGFWKFRLMSGTDREKTYEEINALPEISADEMRTILDEYRKDDPDVDVFVIQFDWVLTDDDRNKINELLGLPEEEPFVSQWVGIGVNTSEFTDYIFDGDNGIDYFDPDSAGASEGTDNILFKTYTVFVHLGAKYELCLCGNDLYADRGDPNLLYGKLSFTVSQYDDVYAICIVPIEGDPVAGSDIYPFYVDKLTDYFDIYTFSRENPETGDIEDMVLIKTAKSLGDGMFATKFCLLDRQGAVIPLQINNAQFPNYIDPSTVRLTNRLAEGWVDDNYSLWDEGTGITVVFDLDNNTFYTQGVEVPEGVPAYDIPEPVALETTTADIIEVSPPVVITNPVKKTFDIQTQIIRRHDPNPGENPVWDRLMVCGDKVYDLMTVEVGAENYIEQVTPLVEDIDYWGKFTTLIQQYLDGDTLSIEKLRASTPDMPAPVGFYDNAEWTRGEFFYLNENYILQTNNNGRGFFAYQYRMDQPYTVMRKVIETLWEQHNPDFRQMTAVLVTDFDGSNQYLKIIDTQENLDAMREILLKVIPIAVTNGNCTFVTPDNERAEWLPVTQLRDTGEGLAYENVEMVSIYNTALDSGIYSGSVEYMPDEYDAVADRLAELGAGEKAEQFRREAAQVFSNGFSFETLTPYDQILDFVKLGKQQRNIYLKITDDIIVKEIIYGDNFDTSHTYVILEKEPQLTAVRNIVNWFRQNREMLMYSDAENKEVTYRIDQLYVIWDKIKTPGSTEPDAKFTVIVENEEEAAYVREYLQYNLIDIPEDRLTVTSVPLDTSDIETYDPF